MTKSPKISVPAASASEQALMAAQTDALRQQQSVLQTNLQQQELLAPYLYQQAGLKPIYEDVPAVAGPSQRYQDTASSGNNFLGFGSLEAARAAGAPTTLAELSAQINQPLGSPASRRIVGFEELPQDPSITKLQELEQKFLEQALQGDELQPLRDQIEKGLLDRSLAALQGKLPVDPSLINSLNEEERTLRDRLLRQFGPGYESTTPGVEALSKLSERRNTLLDASRRGDLTLAESLGIARQGANEQALQTLTTLGQSTGADAFSRNASTFGQLAAIPGFAGATSGGFGSLAAGYSSPLSSLQSDRALRTQVAMQNAQAASQAQSQLFGGLGQLGGMALFSPAFAGSGGAATSLFGRMIG